MSRGRTPTLHCDGSPDNDGLVFECDAWSVDYYEVTASTVDGVRITATRRAPGWQNSDDADRCPEHAPKETP